MAVCKDKKPITTEEMQKKIQKILARERSAALSLNKSLPEDTKSVTITSLTQVDFCAQAAMEMWTGLHLVCPPA